MTRKGRTITPARLTSVATARIQLARGRPARPRQGLTTAELPGKVAQHATKSRFQDWNSMSASSASTAPPPPHEARRRWFRAILAGVVLLAGVAIVQIARAILRAIEARAVTVVVGPADPDAPSPRGDAYAADPVLGLRTRRNLEQRFVIHPLHSSPSGAGQDRIVRRSDNLGLIRTEDVTTLAPGPRALLAGDSHLMGVVSNGDNAADLLERRLRADGRRDVAVYNASCGFYSLYQEVLRLRSFAETLKPDLFIVVCFLGNDFVELEDT